MPSLPWIGFYAFCLTATLLWIPSLRRLWPLFAAVTLGLLMAADLVQPLGAISIIVTGLALLGASKASKRSYANVLYITGVVLVVLLSLHRLPGFTSYQLIPPTQLAADSTTYVRSFRVDQAFAGLLFLALMVPLITTAKEWKRVIGRTLPVAAATIAVVIGAALATHMVAFDPKWSSLFVTFVLSNLFITCISEEILFRRILQGALSDGLRRVRYGAVVAIVFSALLFGLAHFAGGVTYMALAVLAGIGYGYVYHLTGRIEAAIVTHLGLNLTHFLFFTYPSLA